MKKKSYIYCALGKRVMKTDSSGTLLYRPDGDNILLEQDGSGNTIVAYTYNPFGLVGNVISNRKSGTDSYYHYDATGNVMNLTNSGETVVTTYNYDAFGNILAGSSANDKTGFQTKPFEGTDIGLYYSRARYYDPEVGRFTGKDPAASFDHREFSNAYVYVINNPVNYIDPYGLRYVDINVGFGFFGVTGMVGVQIGTGGVFFQAGVGLGTPGPSVNITYSESNPAVGSYSAVQWGTQWLTGGQIGRNDVTGEWFRETGFVTPQINAGTVEVFKLRWPWQRKKSPCPK